MLKNYVPRQYRTEVDYDCIFYTDDNGGFAFPCDAHGNLFPFASDCARSNYEDCMQHPERFKYFNEIREYRRRVCDNAHGTCTCGREVELWDQYQGACECDCGRWYNLFGQELLKPQYWEDDDDYGYGHDY